jgi:hypothetical protein
MKTPPTILETVTTQRERRKMLDERDGLTVSAAYDEAFRRLDPQGPEGVPAGYQVVEGKDGTFSVQPTPGAYQVIDGKLVVTVTLKTEEPNLLRGKKRLMPVSIEALAETDGLVTEASYHEPDEDDPVELGVQQEPVREAGMDEDDVPRDASLSEVQALLNEDGDEVTAVGAGIAGTNECQ